MRLAWTITRRRQKAPRPVRIKASAIVEAVTSLPTIRPFPIDLRLILVPAPFYRSLTSAKQIASCWSAQERSLQSEPRQASQPMMKCRQRLRSARRARIAKTSRKRPIFPACCAKLFSASSSCADRGRTCKSPTLLPTRVSSVSRVRQDQA